jgi:hypothetical protein
MPNESREFVEFVEFREFIESIENHARQLKAPSRLLQRPFRALRAVIRHVVYGMVSMLQRPYPNRALAVFFAAAPLLYLPQMLPLFRYAPPQISRLSRPLCGRAVPFRNRSPKKNSGGSASAGVDPYRPDRRESNCRVPVPGVPASPPPQAICCRTSGASRFGIADCGFCTRPIHNSFTIFIKHGGFEAQK